MIQTERPFPFRREYVVVVGSGLMGRGIGQAFASSGHQVTLVDIDSKILDSAKNQIQNSLSNLSASGLINEPIETILSRLKLEVDLRKAASSATFVVEAIIENLDAKKETFMTLDDSTPKDCILASNTSSLPISKIASATKRPEFVVGTHFWNPPQLMACVEVVKGEKTSEHTVTRTVEILKSAGKRPAIVQKDVPGQIGIRILYAMIREATWLVENQIASPEDIDSIVREAIGTRLEVLGPLELADLSGVDLVYNVAKGGLYRSLDSSSEPQKLIQDMVARGETGTKSGKGFYNWKDGSRSIDSTIRMRDEHLIKILRERKLVSEKVE